MSAADRSAAVAEMGNLTRRRGGPTPLLSLARFSSERHDVSCTSRCYNTIVIGTSLGKEISLLQFLNDLVDNDKIWQPAGTWANKWSYLKRPREKIVDQ
jgi:hypothetical protein